MTSEDLLQVAHDASRAAGRLLLDYWHKPARSVTSKSTPTDLVSEADRAAEREIVELLATRRPDDGIVGEEGGAAASKTALNWVIDPLDGTINFLYGIPHWSVSVAVEDDDGGVAGVVHDPVRGETFSALRGRGAHFGGKRLRVSDETDLSLALIGTGFSYDAQARSVQAGRLVRMLPRVRDIRRAGSAALDLCYVAAGRLDGYFEAPMEHWDRAAGELIVTEAGGTTSELEAPRGLSPGLVAAGPCLHEPLRALVLG